MASQESHRPLADASLSSRNYTNPILWEDLPDMEVFRVDDVYYMSASSFHFSPGAPILRSYNLVDWEYIGHSVPSLAALSPKFHMDGVNVAGYIKGIWASTLKHRRSNGLFYWYGAIQGTNQTYIFTASDPEGPWAGHPPIDNFYYDCGLLIDEDDTMYVAYGTKTIRVAQLSADGLRELTSRLVYDSDEYLEGARMYNINGTYYIWVTKPWDGQYVLISDVGPLGPYKCRKILDNMRSPVLGAGAPHQGALVDTPDGRWYYMAFTDAFPAGRIPVLAPVEFDSEGCPRITADYSDPRGQWRTEYSRMLDTYETAVSKTCIRTHSFSHGRLDHCLEWNQSPDDSKWSIQGGRLILETGTVTDSLYRAVNTLTHRVIGPKSTATFCLNCAKLRDGDRAGAALFRDQSAYIGIHRDVDTAKLVYVDDLTLAPVGEAVGWLNGRPESKDWAITANGSIKVEAPLEDERVWLRITVDVAAACVDGYEKEARKATFQFSYDDVTWTQLGPSFTLTNAPTGFVGYRFAVFNFATKILGGSLAVENWDIAL